jgi:hypothetical protein
MKTLPRVILVVVLAVAALPALTRAAEKTRMDKRQLAAFLASVDAMRRHGYSFHGQQVVIAEAGNSYEITFMDDPIDVAVAGGQHAHGWVIRKRDARVLREFLVR